VKRVFFCFFYGLFVLFSVVFELDFGIPVFFCMFKIGVLIHFRILLKFKTSFVSFSIEILVIAGNLTCNIRCFCVFLRLIAILTARRYGLEV